MQGRADKHQSAQARKAKQIEQYAAQGGALQVLEWALALGRKRQAAAQRARRDAAEEDGARWTPAAELEPSLIELASHAGQAHVVRHLVMAGFTH